MLNVLHENPSISRADSDDTIAIVNLDFRQDMDQTKPPSTTSLRLDIPGNMNIGAFTAVWTSSRRLAITWTTNKATPYIAEIRYIPGTIKITEIGGFEYPAFNLTGIQILHF